MIVRTIRGCFSGIIKPHLSPRLKSLLIASALPLVLVNGHASAVDLGIENDAEYARLIEAMRAAEYVRSDFIVSLNPKPRAYAVLAGTMAFAERNPNASDAQLEAFVQSFDAACQLVSPGDPDLFEPAALYSALRFALVSDSALDGTDTVIGKRALELMGITIPDPDGFESIQRRMVRFEVALARPLDYRSEIFDLLVSGFFGQDPSGVERDALPGILDAYFEGEGFDPELGGTRPDMTRVDAGLAMLPADFAAYELAISMGPENQALRDAVALQLDSVRANIDAIVGTDSMIDDGSLDDALATAPGLEASVELAMDDPAYIQQVLDDLRANLEATAEARAAASAAAYLMLQSDFEEIGTYASYTRDYSQISLETNDTMSHIQSGVSIAGNLAIGIAGVYTGNPMVAAAGFLSAATEALGLAGDLTAGPSVDEQTFEQIVALRQQVEAMRQEMNARFDRIDQQLNIMYNTIVFGFDQIGDQIGDLQDDVDSLIADMAATQSQLRRLEAALYGVAQDILLTDLTNEANVVLDYRDENGVDLPYSGGSPDFITASESFFTYATVTSLSESFAGSRTNPTLTANDTAVIEGTGPVGAYLNDLAVLPQGLGLSPLVSNELPGIEPWSQAASAYAQLARENPWYFAYRYDKQIEDFNNDPENESMPELDRIIRSGDQLVSFIDAIRSTDENGDSELFDAIVHEYKDAASAFQDAIDAEIEAYLPDYFKGNGVAFDFWTDGPQLDIGEVVDGISIFNATGSNDLEVDQNLPDKGYATFIDGAMTEQIALLQMMHLIQIDQAQTPADSQAWVAYFKTPGFINRYEATFWIGGIEPDILFPAYKRVTFTLEAEVFAGVYFPVTTTSQSTMAAGFQDVWVGSPFTGFFELAQDTTEDGSLPSAGADFRGFDYRLEVVSTQNIAFQSSSLIPDLYELRSGARDHLLLELFDEGSALSIAAAEFDRAKAILDAYVSLAMPKELNDSEVLRSALRAVPGASELGLGSVDMITLIDHMDSMDSPNDWADQEFNVTVLDQVLSDRIDLVASEIKRGLERPTTAPGYIGWMLAELGNLGMTAFELARDDTYVLDSSGPLVVGAVNGLLSNDVDQEFRTIMVDTMFDLNPAYIPPMNGAVSVGIDGSFTYTPDPGFSGFDTFSYRSMTMIDGVLEPVLSDPAMVVVMTSESGCGQADLNGDGALDFIDISMFLSGYGSSDPISDLNGDGSYDFLDVSVFIGSYSTGCP